MNIADLAALPFQAGSAIRGRRFFHPAGVLAQGRLERVAPPSRGVPVVSSDVVARISKAAGTPGFLPDFIGLAIRLIDDESGAAPWDILLVSALSGALTRAFALRPAMSWNNQSMTTLMPYRYRNEVWWLRARTSAEIDGPGLSLGSIRRQLERGEISVAMDQARGTGTYEPLARLTLTEVLSSAADERISFDPVTNRAPDLALAPGWLADLRARAYHRSRDGRGASSP